VRTTCFVTNRTGDACVTTQVSREDYNALNRIAEEHGTTKAALVRELIISLVRKMRDPIQDDRAAWPT
jgi:predicted DNA-binding protein